MFASIIDWASSYLKWDEPMFMSFLSFDVDVSEGGCFAKGFFALEMEHRYFFTHTAFQLLMTPLAPRVLCIAFNALHLLG